MNEKLASDPPEAALDWGVASLPMKDYIGLDVFGDEVWTSFMGTWAADPQADKSVIWSSIIDWSP